MSLSQLPRLPEQFMTRGADPGLLGPELRWHIGQAMANHPRSLQREIGPSEIGTPCARKLGHKLAETPKTGDDTLSRWRPTVGTAVHAWLAEAFLGANGTEATSVRWLCETRVCVGSIAGQEVCGSVDLYDRVTATVIDWKIVGATTLRSAKASGPSTTYRTQVHLYGRGIHRRGLPVDTVAIAYLPVAGDLRDMVFWHEPYDREIAHDALKRAEGIIYGLQHLGPQTVVPQLLRCDDYCGRCDYFRPRAEGASACPGADEYTKAAETRAARQLEGII